MVLVCAALIAIPAAVFGAVTLSFPTSSTTLFADQVGNWTVRVTNPDTTAVTGATLVVTLPAGYTVTNKGGGTEATSPNHTLTWTGLTISANGGTLSKSFSAKPDCSAISGGVINAAVGSVSLNSSAITIPSLSVSLTSESPSLSIGEQGTWVFKVTNPSATTDATGRSIVASVPTGFRVVSTSPSGSVTGSTITWSSQTINKSSFITYTINAIPNVGANTAQTMSLYAHCPSTTLTSSPITVKTPSPSVTVTSGGSTQPVIHKGDTVVWDVVVANGGPGDLVNGLSLTETLGAGYTFSSLKDSGGTTVGYTGSWSTGASWNTGAIAAGASKAYKLTVTVTGCTGWSNNVSGTWTDGVTTGGTVSASATAEFLKNLPQVSITQAFPSSLDYCGYPNKGNKATITVENTGAGPANSMNVALSGMPSDWGVTDISVTTGGVGTVTWNSSTKSFSLGNLGKSGGTRPKVAFTFTIGPTGSACPPTTGATLVLFPSYTDECGVSGAPPVVGPFGLSVDMSGLPNASLTLTGPRSVHANDTDLSYTVTGKYSAASTYGSATFTLVATYPSGYTVTDQAGGTLDINARTVTWSGIALSPGGLVEKTIKVTAPDTCGAGQDTAFSASMTASPITTCLGCVIPLSASAGVSTYIDDYRGPITASSKKITYYNSMTSTLDSGLSQGENVTNNQYEVSYTFASGTDAPASWSDTDNLGLGHNITINDVALLSQTLVSIDSVKVNGTEYTGFGTANFPGTPLDLGYLDTAAGAPKPNAGTTTLVVTYTMHSSAAGGAGVDFTRLTIPGYPPVCSQKTYFETGVPVSFSKSALKISANSPDTIDVGEVKQFTIALSADTPWPAYDPILTLDTLGDYTLVGGVGDATYPITFNNFYTINGTSVSAFTPTQLGTKYSWTFGSDLRSHANTDGSGASPSITFYMKKTCDASAKTWSATLDYNDRANDNSATRAYSTSSTGQPILVRKAALDIQVQPASISAYDRYPKFGIIIWNKGSGVAYNTKVFVDNGTSLSYKSYSIPSGSSPDTVTGASGDNDVSFVYNQIAPGEKRYINLTDLLAGNSSLGISVVTTWGETGSPCETITITTPTQVVLPQPQVIISALSVDHKTDYAGHSSHFTVKAKNVGPVTAYNAIISETLPKGFSYVGNPSYSLSSGSFSGTGVPTVSTSGDPANGVTVTWDFSSILPTDSYGDLSMNSGLEITIQFDAVIDGCTGAQAYTSGDKKATALVRFDPPYNVSTGGSILASPTATLLTSPATPKVTITSQSRNVSDGGSFGTGQVLADYGETVEYKIVLTSTGDFLATNVQLATVLPANTSWVSGSTTLDGGASSWQPGVSGSPLSLGEMAVNATHTIIYQVKVNSASGDVIHASSVTWGVSGCSGTVPPMQQTVGSNNLSLRTQPVIAITVTTQSYDLTGLTGFKTDGGKLQIQIVNTGTRALLNSGDYLTIQPPVGFNYNTSTSYAPTISGKAGHTLYATPSTVTNSTAAGDAGRGTLKWDNTKIDYVDQGETITLTFCMEADGYYLDTTCAGYGQTSDPPAIPTSNVQATLQYHYSDSSTPPQQSKSSAALQINPVQPNLNISIAPVSPVIEPGDTQKVFTVTITNNGDATANNIAKVAGSINQPFEFTFGPGFQTPSYTNNCGGSVTFTAATNTITVGNMNSLAANASMTFIVTLNIVPEHAITDYWVNARIRGTALKDSSTEVSAYSVGGPSAGCGSYSDDAVTVNVVQGKLVLRPDNAGTGIPGGQVIYLHSLRNNASYGDTILLTTTNTLGWSSLFYRVDANGQITGGPITQIVLGAAGSGTDVVDFAVRVFIPSSAATGAVNVTTVKATYNSDAQVFRTVTDITTVSDSRLSMKKETRNLTTSGTFGASSQGKPGETIEYKITFKNLSAEEVTDFILSDPIPPFSDLVAAAYSSGGSNYALKFSFHFADATVLCYANSSATHSPVFLELNTLCTSGGPLAGRFAGGIFRLKAGESGELYYQVIIRQ